jgi:hypothetical protein
MRILILCLFIIFTQTSFAKDGLVNDCAHLKEASEVQLAIFSKKELIELGECLAVYTIERKSIIDLPMFCGEVIEDESTPLGDWSLTKLEAIYIGQCFGVVDYIYTRYNKQFFIVNNNGYRSNRKYSCYRGGDAVKILRKKASNKMSEYDIRDLLCEVR